MKFIIKTSNETIITLARKIGYRPIGVENDEYSIVKTLAPGKNYPRFHIYIKKIREEEREGEFELNLHLDQKQPSYEGTSAHSGEYEGKLVEKEAERIQKIITQKFV